MKLSEFDFRVWNNNSKTYEAGNIIESLGFITSVFNQLTYEKPTIDYEIELFTGLYDKNGNKVYEGDILHYSNCHTNYEVYAFKVVFIEGTFNLVEFHDGNEYYQDIMTDFLSTELEVVGNIHENKELLGVKK
ncbi:hypothetical protein I7U11_001638 [Campylobacter coli]|nr:hypothetical protein [Campylobacter coli]